MNRRRFLQILTAPAGLAAAELIVPHRTIFLPPRGGWPIADGKIGRYTGFEVLEFPPRVGFPAFPASDLIWKRHLENIAKTNRLFAFYQRSQKSDLYGQ